MAARYYEVPEVPDDMRQAIDAAIEAGYALDLDLLARTQTEEGEDFDRPLFAGNLEYALMEGEAPGLWYAIENGAHIEGDMVAYDAGGNAFWMHFDLDGYESFEGFIHDYWAQFREQYQ